MIDDMQVTCYMYVLKHSTVFPFCSAALLSTTNMSSCVMMH